MEVGSVVGVSYTTLSCSDRLETIIAASRVVETLETSIRLVAQELDISTATHYYILTRDLYFHAYEMQFIQQLLPTHHA